MEDVDIIFESWLEKQEWPSNKTKGLFKRASAKPAWKKFYFVLKRHNERDCSFLHWYEKEEHRNSNQSKGYFELTPKIFKIYKKGEDKGKCIFEMTNDALMCRLAADNMTLMDLWVIQLQMLVKLNPRIAGRLFPVRGASTKDMSRIGAKSQNLLLHVSKWGVTVALQRTAAVLAQWPLTTIRNYESMDSDEFAFEAGRKAPMGEGKYNFLTRESGDDNVIFDTIDEYTQQRLDAKRLQRQGSISSTSSATTAQSRESLEEEEINKTYDMLRFSVQGIPNTVVMDEPPVAAGVRPSEPRNINNGSSSTATYNHLGRSNSVSHNNSSSSGDSSLERSGDFLAGFPERSASLGSYNHLDPISSWNSYRSTAPLLRPDSYDHLSMSIGSEASSYDRLAASRSFSRTHSGTSNTRMKELSPDEMESVMRSMPGRPAAYERPRGDSLPASPDYDPDYDRPLPVPPMLPQISIQEERLGLPTGRPRMPSPSSVALDGDDPRGEYMNMANKASFVFLNNAFSGSADNISPNIIRNPTYSPTKHKKTKSQENVNRIDNSILVLRRSRSEEDFLDGATMRANAVSLGSNPPPDLQPDNLVAGSQPVDSSLPYRNSNERIRSIFKMKKKTGKGKDKEKTKDNKKKPKGKTDNEGKDDGTIYAEIPGQAGGTYSLPYEKVNGGKMVPSIEEFEMVAQDTRSVSPQRSLPSPREESGFVVVDAQYTQIGSTA